MSSVYTINKGIGRAITFKGFKAQYIGYLAGSLVALLVLFAVLYTCGADTYVCLVLVLGSGTYVVMRIFRLSHRYGEHGLMKRNARRNLPPYIRFTSRRLFINLKTTGK
jgi:4-hydroxybenzoate polyprenyltransferase